MLPNKLKVAAPRHIAKKNSFLSAPRIVSGRDSDRCTRLTLRAFILSFALRYAFRLSSLLLSSLSPLHPGKSRERKFTAAIAIPTPNRTPARFRFEPPSPNANVSPATTIATKLNPRAIVLVNAVCNTFTAFSHGEFPVCANEGAARARPTGAVRKKRERQQHRRIIRFTRKPHGVRNAGPKAGEGRLSATPGTEGRKPDAIEGPAVHATLSPDLGAQLEL
jgi:hypothetical protein